MAFGVLEFSPEETLLHQMSAAETSGRLGAKGTWLPVKRNCMEVRAARKNSGALDEN